jgi:uncharacterized protein YbjT (DUF2867 family)
MDIAVIGGKGRLGGSIVAELRHRGLSPRVLSRSSPEYPVDLTTGAGLEAALAGADVVVNAANSAPTADGHDLFVQGTERLLAAEARARVQHHVEIAIVGAERVPLKYYKAKVEQEKLVRGGAVPWTIVRATQFHEFLAWGFDTAAGKHVLPGGRVPIQPVAVDELAAVIADVATREPQRRVIAVAGPQVEALGDLAAEWRSASGRHAVRVPLPGVTRVTRALRSGGLVTDTPDVRTATTFATWLKTHA